MNPADAAAEGSPHDSASLSEVRKALSAAHAEIERLSSLLASRDIALERAHSTYEARLLGMRHTLVWRLGEILVHGFRTPQGIVRIPGALLRLHRDFRQRRASRERAQPELEGEAVNHLLKLFQSGGHSAVSSALDAQTSSPHHHAKAYAALTRALMPSNPNAAARMARSAYDSDPTARRAAWLAFRLYDAGLIEEPARLLALLPSQGLAGAGEKRRANLILGQARLKLDPPLPARRSGPAYTPRTGAILYVAASSRPHHTSGYTVRTHALIAALKTAGLDVKAITRPGYPWDRSDFHGTSGNSSECEGILYHHAKEPDQHLPMDAYTWRAADVIAAAATEHRAAVIHAASNHVNALPALLAARRLGIPFHYEMRGLWDLSRASKQPGFEDSERFSLGQSLEFHVAANADRLWVISSALADYLAERVDLSGVPVGILPNGIDPVAFADIVAEPPATFTLGYAGALVPYEGLDLLIDAIGRLRARGVAIAAEIMGDGESRAALEARARGLGLDDVVRFHGRVSPQDAQQRLARTSLICLPRRPSTVCEIVPPLKLVEAMALGVPLVVPDLPVFRDEAEEGRTARFFRAGDLEDLVAVLEACASAPADLVAMGQAARRHALEQRGWHAHAVRIAEAVGLANPTSTENGKR